MIESSRASLGYNVRSRPVGQLIEIIVMTKHEEPWWIP